MPCNTTIMSLTAVLMFLSGGAFAQDDAGSEEALLAFNNNCRRCHVTNEGDNRLGPSLYGIIGREAGTVPGFRYSSAMSQADIVWDEENLDRYIEDPNAVVPGNNMKPYPGIPSPELRAQIIAHLKAESEGGDE